MEYNGGLEKAILRDSELLSEVNDAFCKSHPLLAQKVVTRSFLLLKFLTSLPPFVNLNQFVTTYKDARGKNL